MTARPDPDPAIEAWLEAEAAAHAPERLLTATRDRVRSTPQRRAWWPARRTWSMSRTTLAAAVVVAAFALGGAYLLSQRGQTVVTAPTPSELPSPSPSQPAAAVAPSATPASEPTATPSPTPTPLLWTEASLDEDWPAPVRPEPDGGAIVLPLGSDGVASDPLGDNGSDVLPWVDIREVSVGSHVLTITLASNERLAVEPTEQWIAYGVVFDDDDDGVPDRRYGMDNLPDDAPDGFVQGDRQWVTDLHTGRTQVFQGDGIEGNPADGSFLDANLPGKRCPDCGARFAFGGDAAGGGTMGMALDQRPLYAWASVIQNGRVVATDYAPDAGWLEREPTPPEPSPTPGPSPDVEIDPDVPGGLLWTVRVVNMGSTPARLVVAEMREDDPLVGPVAGRLVGTVSPSVVPAGATRFVTIALPPKGSNPWAVFVNPGPDMGPTFTQRDVPLAGEFRIDAKGNVGWLSP